MQRYFQQHNEHGPMIESWMMGAGTSGKPGHYGASYSHEAVQDSCGFPSRVPDPMPFHGSWITDYRVGADFV